MQSINIVAMLVRSNINISYISKNGGLVKSVDYKALVLFQGTLNDIYEENLEINVAYVDGLNLIPRPSKFR